MGPWYITFWSAFMCIFLWFAPLVQALNPVLKESQCNFECTSLPLSSNQNNNVWSGLGSESICHTSKEEFGHERTFWGRTDITWNRLDAHVPSSRALPQKVTENLIIIYTKILCIDINTIKNHAIKLQCGYFTCQYHLKKTFALLIFQNNNLANET